MALFGFHKKTSMESIPPDSFRSIRVLGSGCKSCHALLEATQAAVRQLNLHTEVEYVTDLQTIATYGVMQMPALMVDERVVSVGKVLKTDAIVQLLRKESHP